MIYRDSTAPVEARVEDLLSRMTLEEKAGQMFHTILLMGPDGELWEGESPFGHVSTDAFVSGKLMTHFNILQAAPPAQMAGWHNRLQELAARTRLGIPVTISSDPRHSFTDNPATALFAGAFSQWPEFLGMAATRDAELVRAWADIVRREYLAVGIRVALHPMADLATEPRWARAVGTFGESAELAAELVAAYIRGIQGDELGPHSVAAMTKHFPGGGPQKDGEDPHFAYGREQVYPGGRFEHHLIPFEAAFAAGTSQIMPYYGMPVGTDLEEVAFGFNRGVITALLREKYGFDGIVCTDWGLLNDMEIGETTEVARAWGVEDLTPRERARKALDAGVDQFGGEACPELIVSLVRDGEITEERIDVSVRRLLREKFRLGLFDAAPLDPDEATATVGRADFRAAGLEAQRRSLTLLKNDGVLPLRPGVRVYTEGVDLGPEFPTATSPADADVAILHLTAPYEPRSGNFLEALFHAGDLSFPPSEIDRITAIAAQTPTVIVIHLDRPAVMPEINEAASAVLAEYGADDTALTAVLTGAHSPEGQLPFDLPSSMKAVEANRPDVPHDTADPLYPFGHGLTY
ncbi:glycoside hydrolase family 3 protein [Actinocorallia sp. A-T 12471]|uniref:glycoside hydrolase family 3 protein n=1 Tax=Actinocorallia sp. A-T 12471 TaxID=3089813 RepID=UPI0029CB7228|nr:glycoside hydrolase family 3 N-terminal domain-containing protein [Actinocorallia sp. A-T 12471]MDX6741570.1 glycoside hydrolase family 3 N-terminal domain-containing protein [Actinocorallia sp. A-T 12471]